MALDRETKRAYDRIWVSQRRKRCLDYLGGICCGCEATEELEFDHIDRTTKSFTISSNYNRSWPTLVRELDKCQLLCHACHRAKTVANGEAGGGHNKATQCPHGTLSGYGAPWACRCTACKQAKAESRKKYQISGCGASVARPAGGRKAGSSTLSIPTNGL